MASCRRKTEFSWQTQGKGERTETSLLPPSLSLWERRAHLTSLSGLIRFQGAHCFTVVNNLRRACVYNRVFASRGKESLSVPLSLSLPRQSGLGLIDEKVERPRADARRKTSKTEVDVGAERVASPPAKFCRPSFARDSPDKLVFYRIIYCCQTRELSLHALHRPSLPSSPFLDSSTP